MPEPSPSQASAVEAVEAVLGEVGFDVSSWFPVPQLGEVGFDVSSWFPVPQLPPLPPPREWEAAEPSDCVLRCREQALHSASIMFDTGGQFPEDDAEKVVAVAKRFERFMRTGQ